METLASIESFVRSAETNSFSAAARLLGLTPAAVSKNVATLERKLGVRLFQRSTRRLTLTEAGDAFLLEVSGGLNTVQAALANASRNRGQPSGTLKVSLAFAFGRQYILPLVARELARPYMVLVASPTFLADKKLPKVLADLSAWDAIVRRSSNTGRIQPWHLRSKNNEQEIVEPKARVILNDPETICNAALMHLGVALVPLPHVLPYLEDGSLIRLLPKWYSDVGPLAIYFASSTLLPAKTRVFVDFIVEHFRSEELAKKFSVF